jgi:hypothetical protein
LVFKFFGEVCLNYMTSVKAGYLLKALTGKSKIIRQVLSDHYDNFGKIYC